MANPNDVRWLLLIHQLPPKPSYFRVKIWRRLQRLGAVAIKNSVYALPASEQTHEDFQWVRKEIVEGGGEASVCEARFVDGLDDEQVEALFQAARDADYAQLAEAVREMAKARSRRAGKDNEDLAEKKVEVERLKRRLVEVVTIDFFHSPGRQIAEAALLDAEARLEPAPIESPREITRERLGEFRNRTWVTRKGIFVDRMASAWLIRRFIDPRARFKFVVGKGYKPRKKELRFDMFEAEFTHVGDRCTFEVLVERFGLSDPAVSTIAEIVHDIDLKDSKYGRQDAIGIEQVLAGIAGTAKDDDERLTRGAAIFEDLYEYHRKKRG